MEYIAGLSYPMSDMLKEIYIRKVHMSASNNEHTLLQIMMITRVRQL